MNVRKLFILTWKKFFITIALGVVAVVLHNVVSALMQTEEGLFFILAVFVFPLYLLVSFVVTLFQFLRRKR